jgi:Membrane protein involved in the export of O-antigen and teichoic acid
MNLSDKFFSLFQRDAMLFFATLLTGIVIARQLGPEMMGVWTILLLIPGYAEAFGRLQFDQSAVYFIGKKKADIGEITFLLHVVAVVATAIIISIFFVGFDWFYGQLFKNVELDARAFAYAILSLFPLRLIYINYSYLLIAQEDVLAYNSVVILQAFITSVASIGMILIFDMGLMGALMGSVMGLIISIVYAANKVQQLEKLKPNFNLKLLYEMAKYAVHHYISGLIGYFQSNVTSLIAVMYIAPAQVAFYAVGKSICEVATRMVPAAVNTVLFPRVSRTENAHDSSMLVARLFRITLLILLLSSCVLAILIKPVVFILYGSDYYPLIVPFLIMIAGVVVVQSATVFSSYFSGRGRPDLLAKISVLPLLIQIFLAVFLVPEYGVNGAALSFVLSAILLFFAQIFCFLRFSGLSLKDIVIQFQDVTTVWSFALDKLTIIIGILCSKKRI